MVGTAVMQRGMLRQATLKNKNSQLRRREFHIAYFWPSIPTFMCLRRLSTARSEATCPLRLARWRIWLKPSMSPCAECKRSDTWNCACRRCEGAPLPGQPHPPVACLYHSEAHCFRMKGLGRMTLVLSHPLCFLDCVTTDSAVQAFLSIYLCRVLTLCGRRSNQLCTARHQG